MDKFHICAGNIIEKDGKFLLVQETKEIAKGKFHLPCGKLEEKEAVLDAAIREAEEETGLRVKPRKLIGCYQRVFAPLKNNTVNFIFASDIISGEIQTSKEHPIVKFFSLEEIKELNGNDMLRAVWLLEALQDYLSGKAYDLSAVKTFTIDKADI